MASTAPPLRTTYGFSSTAKRIPGFESMVRSGSLAPTVKRTTSIVARALTTLILFRREDIEEGRRTSPTLSNPGGRALKLIYNRRRDEPGRQRYPSKRPHPVIIAEEGRLRVSGAILWQPCYRAYNRS